jgi:thiol-disulfide isomerase/thioredoxin
MITRRELVLAGLSLSACAHSRDSGAPRFATFGAYLPRETADGSSFDATPLQGQVVLITFLATWCFPCLAEIVTLTHLEREFGEKGFSSVVVGMDLEGRLVLEPFARGYKLGGPVLVADAPLRSGETPFGRIRELPTRMLFGRDGALVVGFTGVAQFEDLERLVAGEVARKLE